jgi:hypothetical protein
LRVRGALLILAVSIAAAEEPAARSRQIAAILGLEPVIERIESAPAGGGLEAILERLELRDDTLAELQHVDLLISVALALIDQEQSAAASAQSIIAERHDHSVASWNIAALIVGNVTSIVGSAMQFDGTRMSFAGDGIILGGAAVATAFSIVALSRHNRGRPPHPIKTNVLAPLLGRVPNADSTLPEPVWKYLDTPLAGAPTSLRNQLIQDWQRRGNISLDDSPSARRRIDLLTRPLSAHEVIHADVLDDRAVMLADLHGRVAAMHVDMELLIREVRARRVARP